ncbi:hypothetical protein OnM2_078018 [Erysiphe neolycopersici]|uniref:Uncharacterized protein n=1 Tax=Erysiphe neolycopersici TaxID=212602 RepID=A0A420HHG8_9PEZI|nr:hypothetical protein OnM2_078018 [Erysiphe neolycopersici]
MSRYIVGVLGMVIFLAVMIMTFVAITMPSWMIHMSVSETPGQTGLRQTIGLYKLCSSPGLCRPFPQYEDCKVMNKNFCNTWRSIGFFMWIASITYMASLVGFIFVVFGGAQKWERGWKFLSISLLLGAAFECASISAMANLLKNENYFLGWHLGTSWIISTLSWIISVLLAAFIVVSEYIFEPEGDYELIPIGVSFP